MKTAIKIKYNDSAMIWFVMAVLAALGILAVYSSTARIGASSPAFYMYKQLKHLGMGALLCLAVSRLRLSSVRGGAMPIFWGVTALWWGMQIWSVAHGHSSPRSVYVPLLGSFQPVELAKVAVVLYIPRTLSLHQEGIRKFKFMCSKIVLPLALLAAPVFFSNFSSSLIILLSAAALMWLGSVRTGHLLVMGLILLLALRIGMFITSVTMQHNDAMRRHHEKPAAFWLYAERIMQVSRLTTIDSRWRNFKQRVLMGDDVPNAKKAPKDFEQIDYAHLAIASGAVLPWRGPGNSDVKYMLPEAFSDFIFAIIVEEYGVLLAFLFILLPLCMVLPWRIGVNSKRSKNSFAVLLALGVCVLLTLQTIMHVFVSVGLMPVTGQNLPLVSHGGSSILCTCVLFGLLLNVVNYISGAREREAADAAASSADSSQ